MLQRNLGLDMVRSLSIIMVIISHSKSFFLPHVQNQTFLLNLSILGLYAVETFFVLSGFLIGGIIMREIPFPATWPYLRRFFLRRWLRTLPAYYLVLVGLLLIYHATLGMTSWHWRHFVFLQNFDVQELGFFGVSWTLALEEWFYLLAPLTLALFLRRPEHVATRLPWLMIGAFTVMLFSRYIYVLAMNPSWDSGVRKFIPIRFDPLFFGIGVAWIKQYQPAVYRILAGKFTFGACLSGLIGIGYYYAGKFPTPALLDTSIFARVWSFSLIAFFLAATLPFFEQSQFVNRRMASFAPTRIFFSRTSRYAYMIYLIHLDVFIALFDRGTSLISATGWLVFALLVSCPVAILLHHYYEKPIMDLRDRLPELPEPKQVTPTN